MSAAGPALAGWTPVRVRSTDDGPVVRWYFTEGIEFTDPFFDETIRRAARDRFRLLFWRETGIDALTDFARERPGLEPAGIIFHLSRSGSTLAAQMFAGLPTVLVMSEPPPFDHVLRARTTHPDRARRGRVDGKIDSRVDWLAALGSALGQPRRRDQAHFILKLDAWAVLEWPIVLSAFPRTPCVFVYRDPLDVLVSQLGHRGFHMIPGTLPPDLLGIDPATLAAMTPEVYAATVLACLAAAGLAAARTDRMALVNYDTLPAAVGDVLAPAFGVEVGPAEHAVFSAVAERDAKNPAVPYGPEAA